MAEEPVLTSPKISIIVPVYKVEQYLRRCLDSIEAQTFTDWECILIDDGSPDNSGVICDEYVANDTRFRVIHQENKGVSAARNAGLDVARGEWIGFVDSDDWIEPEMYETLLTKAINTSADIVSCNSIDETEWDSILKVNDIAISNSEILLKLLKNQMHGALYLYLIKRELFRDISFVEGMNICEDLLVSIKLFADKPRTAHISSALYHYRTTNNSSITRSVFSKTKCQQLEKSVELIEHVLQEKGLVQEHLDGILSRRKYVKLKILYKSTLKTGFAFYGLYPGLSKHIEIRSASELFQKVLLFNAEIRNIPFVWLCLGFFKLFWAIKNRHIKR